MAPTLPSARTRSSGAAPRPVPHRRAGTRRSRQPRDGAAGAGGAAFSALRVVVPHDQQSEACAGGEPGAHCATVTPPSIEGAAVGLGAIPPPPPLPVATSPPSAAAAQKKKKTKMGCAQSAAAPCSTAPTAGAAAAAGDAAKTKAAKRARDFSPWSAEEDAQLLRLVRECQPGTKMRWTVIARGMHARTRTSKQCCERYTNQVDPSVKKGPWSAEEVAALQAAHAELGNKWSAIALRIPGRPANAVKNKYHGALSTAPSARRASGGVSACPPTGLAAGPSAAAETKVAPPAPGAEATGGTGGAAEQNAAKGGRKREGAGDFSPWSGDEDAQLLRLAAQYPPGTKTPWAAIARGMQERTRTAKQCRERYTNQVDPAVKKGPWSAEEVALLHQAHGELGNRWSAIALRIPGRPANAVKNKYHGINRALAVAARCRAEGRQVRSSAGRRARGGSSRARRRKAAAAVKKRRKAWRGVAWRRGDACEMLEVEGAARFLLTTFLGEDAEKGGSEAAHVSEAEDVVATPAPPAPPAKIFSVEDLEAASVLSSAEYSVCRDVMLAMQKPKPKPKKRLRCYMSSPVARGLALERAAKRRRAAPRFGYMAASEAAAAVPLDAVDALLTAAARRERESGRGQLPDGKWWRMGVYA